MRWIAPRAACAALAFAGCVRAAVPERGDGEAAAPTPWDGTSLVPEHDAAGAERVPVRWAGARQDHCSRIWIFLTRDVRSCSEDDIQNLRGGPGSVLVQLVDNGLGDYAATTGPWSCLNGNDGGVSGTPPGQDPFTATASYAPDGGADAVRGTGVVRVMRMRNGDAAEWPAFTRGTADLLFDTPAGPRRLLADFTSSFCGTE